MVQQSKPARELSLFDGVCLIVGIMVGAGLFESAPTVAQYTSNPEELVGVWLLGGVLSLLGALSYAGLAKAFPETGGDYVFLKRAFGSRFGFLYAWSMLTVVRPGSLGAMSYVFADYAQQIFSLGVNGRFLYAAGSILLLSAVNALGTREGKGIQNILTMAKIAGLLLFVLMALTCATTGVPATMPSPVPPSFTLALIFVLFTYGGWNEIAFVAAEVKHPERNLFRTLFLGTLLVTGLYVFVCLSFLSTVGFQGLRESKHLLRGSFFVEGLIAISALGAVHGMIFSGSRIYYAMGQDHRLFSALGRWSKRGTPLWSILTESAITLALMALFSHQRSGFESLVLYTTPLFWLFMAGVAMAVFKILSRKQARESILGYPWTPVLFLFTCVFMLFMSLKYAFENGSMEILWSLGVVAAGLLIEGFETLRGRRR